MFDVIVVGTRAVPNQRVSPYDRAHRSSRKLTGATLHIVSAFRPVSLGSVALAASRVHRRSTSSP